MTTKNKTQHLIHRSTFQQNKLAQAVHWGSRLVVASAIGWHGVSFAQTDAQAGSDIALEEILVSGQRASIQNALEIKRDADSIMDVIAADDIGALPGVLCEGRPTGSPRHDNAPAARNCG